MRLEQFFGALLPMWAIGLALTAPGTHTAAEGLALQLPAAHPDGTTFSPDPAARVFGERLYLYTGDDHDTIAGHDFAGMNRWHVFWTDDLKTWHTDGDESRLGFFGLSDVPWGDQRAYAADAIAAAGRYYFFYTCAYQIGVAVSAYPDGVNPATGRADAFVNLSVTAPLIGHTRNYPQIRTETMDPCPFIDADGRAYLFWGGHDQLPAVVRLNPDLRSWDEQFGMCEVAIQGVNAATDFHEGVYIHRRGAVYYLSWVAHDEVAGKYSIQYGSAQRVLGPYQYRGEILRVPDDYPLLAGSAADGSAVYVHPRRNTQHSIVEFKGRWYLFYHLSPGVKGAAEQPAYRRRTCLAPLQYREAGAAGAEILPVAPGAEQP